MKKRISKNPLPKPTNDKSYSGRQKKTYKSDDSFKPADRGIDSKKKDWEKPKVSSAEGFRKPKRKRISSVEKPGEGGVKKRFETSRTKRDSGGKPFKSFRRPGKAEGRQEEDSKAITHKKIFKKRSSDEKDTTKGEKRTYRPSRGSHNPRAQQEKKETPTYKIFSQKNKAPKPIQKSNPNEIRLNRYIANAGICSRREADELIAEGLIKVNNVVVTEMGYKVKPGDEVRYENKLLKREKFVYVLLNKPKDFITTTDDPEERRTVMDLVKNACDERIYPVGRLDRNTTGLLLLTNDGELAEKLSHPSHNIKKVYQVEIDKPITDEDFEKIKAGVELEDGKAFVDDLSIITPDNQVVGIEIHLGRNRIVRRIFEHLGYTVLRLDRVSYAGLTKKDLTRGHWRFLSEKEVIQLKHFS